MLLYNVLIFFLIFHFDLQGNDADNLSPVVGTSDHPVIFEVQEISDEYLNIKLNNVFTENNIQTLSSDTLQASEVSVSDRPHHFHNHSFSGLHW